MKISISHPTDRPNFSVLTLGDLTLWFSYNTAIAFHTPDTGYVVSKNIWGPTTGKHLNLVAPERHVSRVPRGEFEERLAALTDRLTLTPGLSHPV